MLTIHDAKSIEVNTHITSGINYEHVCTHLIIKDRYGKQLKIDIFANGKIPIVYKHEIIEERVK